MSFGVPKIKHGRRAELARSLSQSQMIADKLKQDGLFDIVESLMQAVDQVAAQMHSKNGGMLPKNNIIDLCQHLKMYGAFVERVYEDQLNRAFVTFRNYAQDNERIDDLTRIHLLELIESRASGWKGNDVMSQYYKKKINQYVQSEASESASLTDSMIASSISSASLLGPGEILKQSGKFPKPTHIPGKHYYKDEVVIRNADSGKVMGIKGRRVHMIEELSETIISFQRVNPGAKERLVQITGANEDSINNAKQLIEDTIRRNASPVRELSGPTLTGSSSSINSSTSEDSALPHSARASRTLLHSLSTNDANFEEYKFTVVVRDRIIKISGDDINLVRMSKILLDEYFSGEPLPNHLYNIDDIAPNMVSSRLSPQESLPSPAPSTGESEEPPIARLRRPKTSLEDIMKRRPSTTGPERMAYSHELLAKLAMSPLCLGEPNEWQRISSAYPNLIRGEGQYFDANQYLTKRSEGILIDIDAEP